MNTTNDTTQVIFEGAKIGKVSVDAATVPDANGKLLEMILASHILVDHITVKGDRAMIFRDAGEADLWDTASISEMPDFTTDFGGSNE